MAKKSATRKGQKRTAAAAGGAGRRKTAGARTAKRKAARKSAGTPARRGKAAAKTTTRAGGGKKKAGAAKKAGGVKKAGRAKKAGGLKKAGGAMKMARRTAKSSPGPRKRTAPARGGTGREETLDQTPETGRSRRGPTNPMRTRRSTGTPAGAGTSGSSDLDRARTELRKVEEGIQTPPSSLNLDRLPSAARSGRRRLQEAQAEHTETSPVLTGGDVDADWEDAYAVGDEAPGGDNPTPDQDRVDDIGKALGVEYQDNEELRASDKIAERDRHRWELDPASAEDYRDRDKE